MSNFDNGDDDNADSDIMSFVKSAIHKNVDNMIEAGRAPFTNMTWPRAFSNKKCAAPTCVIVMSCRVRNFPNLKHDQACEARTLLRQTSIDITERSPNILWDTNGPVQFSPPTACIHRLCDKQQILTIDAHGETEIDLTAQEPQYWYNKSNIFWVFPAVTGLSLRI